MKTLYQRSIIKVLLFFCCIGAHNALAQADTVVLKNIIYATAENKKLDLDIYRLKTHSNPYLVVWVHGGAWHSGSKEDPPLQLLGYGYALASLNFRLSTEKPFPAQVFDIKAAIRFLRANAAKYGYRADKLIIWGSSSGGHLAALVATTNNLPQLEGTLGDHTQTSSAVQACIDFFGPTNLLTILNQSTPHGLSVRLPALAILLGKPLEQDTALARLASPVYQVTKEAPPLFIAHGEQDIQVPVNQSLELMTAYQQKNRPVQIEFLPNAGHGGNAFTAKELFDKIDRFLKQSGF